MPRIQAIEISMDYFPARGRMGRLLPLARQILPGIYRRLTIPGHLCR
jgi:hypothetical protein